MILNLTLHFKASDPLSSSGLSATDILEQWVSLCQTSPEQRTAFSDLVNVIKDLVYSLEQVSDSLNTRNEDKSRGKTGASDTSTLKDDINGKLEELLKVINILVWGQRLKTKF